MRSRRVLQTLGMAAGMFLVIAAAAHAGETWNSAISMAPGGILNIQQTALRADKDITVVYSPGDRRGGLAVQVVPTLATDITTVNANELNIDGYILNITSSASAFGALQISGADQAGGTWDVWIKNTNLANVNLTNNKVNFTTDAASGATPSGFGGAADFRGAGNVSYRWQ